MELKNKTVIITGGTKGLGLALARGFENEGANVVVCSRSEEEFKNVSGGVLAVKADVTKEEDLENVLNIAKEKFGGVDIWINNAGIWLPHRSIEETDWRRAHDLIEVNLFGTVYGSKVALSEMKKKNEGVIINILSTSALEGKINETAYCSSKFASDGFTKSLRKELEETGIKILAVYPGGMKTDLFNEEIPEKYSDYMTPEFVAEKIISNLKSDSPEEELIIRRN